MKIVVTGNYGAQNLGDEMILKGLLQTLRRVVPFAELTVLSGNPEETARAYQVNSLEKFPAGFRTLLKAIFGKNRETAKAVKACDYFILGGGGLFGGLKKRANIIWGIQAMMAYLYKKPVIMYGQSIGTLNHWFDRWIVKMLFKRTTAIIVRDKRSKERLEILGIKKKIHICPDLAFRFRINEPAIQRKNNIIVALRQMENLSPLFKKTIADFLNWLISEHKWTATFITFQKGAESDEQLHEEVMEMIIDKPYMDSISEHDPEKIIKSFMEAEMTLGMRLHSLVSSIKTSTPFIAVNYAPKVGDLLELGGLGEYVIDMDELSVQKLREQFEKIQTEKDKIKNKIEKYNENTAKDHEEMEVLLKKVLK